MQYLKLGPVKIPYKIQTEGEKKTFQILGIKVPFTTTEKNGQKYYKLFSLPLRLPFLDKYFITQSKSNYLMRDQLTDEKIRRIAAGIFQEKLGYAPDLEHPRSMNEKIFWMKLNYHDPLVTTCCDKFAVKDYVTEHLGQGFVVPTIASWENPDDIDFDSLPDQFVLKVNWSSGYNIIVKDKSQLDRQEALEKLRHWMQPQQNSYYQTFNWGYKNMKPIVYAETYMEQVDGQLYDYKFYCCNGQVKFLFIATDRHTGGKLTYTFFDRDFCPLPFTYGGRSQAANLEKPQLFEEMIRCAEILSKPFPFVRVDFYETQGKLFVGEMTFYSGGGILPFDPVEWDYKLGEYIPLP